MKHGRNQKNVETSRKSLKRIFFTLLHYSINFSFLLISSTQIGKFVQNKGKLPIFQQFDFLVKAIFSHIKKFEIEKRFTLFSDVFMNG